MLRRIHTRRNPLLKRGRSEPPSPAASPGGCHWSPLFFISRPLFFREWRTFLWGVFGEQGIAIRLHPSPPDSQKRWGPLACLVKVKSNPFQMPGCLRALPTSLPPGCKRDAAGFLQPLKFKVDLLWGPSSKFKGQCEHSMGNHPGSGSSVGGGPPPRSIK